ncbi:MAG TPA: hypothetical protein VGD45_12675 [Steroidobacter sp.]|uniref:hypothetical protein n=1 Tax=Steroidobacter sp. TaxID=1978227 RepID=UPI002EDAB335
MRRATSLRIWAACFLLGLLHSLPASAVTVTALAYDATEDQLVMTIAYRGTHENHDFTVQWTECKRLDDARSQILGLLVDSAPNDLARQNFTKQVKVDLTSFTCRPSKVTIRTSAGFFASVDVPPPPKKQSPLSEARNAP